MELHILSPNGYLYRGEADSVTLPGIAGSFEVRPMHAPLITALTQGVIRYRVHGAAQQQEIGSGFVEVNHDVLSVCIETSES